MNNKIFLAAFMPIFLMLSLDVYGHDTTHIHPLITLGIAKVIRSDDSGTDNDNAYNEIYELLLEPQNIKIIPKEDQFLYWGTDLDPVEIARVKGDDELFIDYLGADKTKPYINIFGPIAKNIITGVVYEDVPAHKVLNKN